MRSRLPSKMPQPATLKRQNDKSSNEPAAKRKTLVERAGEPASTLTRTPSVRKPSVQGASLVDMKSNFTQPRNTSHSSSVSSRTPSVSSRHTSSSSFFQKCWAWTTKVCFRFTPTVIQSTSTTSRPNTSLAKGRPHASKDSTSSDDEAFDVRGRLDTMEAMYAKLASTVDGTNKDHDNLRNAVSVYKAKLDELEGLRTHLTSSNQTLQTNLDDTAQRLSMIQQRLIEATTALDDNIRAHRLEMDDVNRSHRNERDR
ncbi:hypothetical protein DID88_003706 [Monilinia fructigena]|uniref:Uncharacterized protein n=1 Tax=Monilinia fructigena TaxID=38457 RepID=A0A395IW71_9HELO|nr:hypothetical protein DID88_003706 [Monilinia fructigena]